MVKLLLDRMNRLRQRRKDESREIAASDRIVHGRRHLMSEAQLGPLLAVGMGLDRMPGTAAAFDAAAGPFAAEIARPVMGVDRRHRRLWATIFASTSAGTVLTMSVAT